MRLLHLAAASLNQTPLDWEGNKRTIVAAIEEAKRQSIDVLCLPELCISGYGCEDAFFSPGVHDTSMQVLREVLPHTTGIVVSLGLPVLHNNGIYDTACLVADGRVLGFVAKQNLAGEGVHYEPRWFKPWPAGHRSTFTHDGVTYPFGDYLFEVDGVRIGFEICEDAWAARRPGSDLSERAVDVILNPSASHFAFGKHEVRKRFCLEGSRAFGVAYIYSNLVGCEAGRIIYDGDCLITSAGALVAESRRFPFAEWTLTSAIVDIERNRLNQAQRASYSPNVTSIEGMIVDGAFRFARRSSPPKAPEASPAEWERSPNVKTEEFCRAVTLGLFDYLRKSRSHGFVVSLSGGADSSAVSCLVALMIRMGVDDLGIDRFKERLSFIESIAAAADVPSLTRSLLTCVYQRTRNNSEVTRTAATTLARELGAGFMEFEVDSFVDSYIALVSRALGRELSWGTDDLALQNVQARARVPGIWLLANVKKALLLTTSNRSEAAVGYATMDGDTSGGLNPIGGIDKAFLREWLRWLEASGPSGTIRYPALSLVNSQAPTAELRPLETKQTDEADLMPYEVLDIIERLAIRDKQPPLDCFLLVESKLGGRFSREQLGAWVERFFKLWSINQWKRERYAPSFHVDDENLDPKTWCRFPILSGGYQRELETLRRYLAEGAK